MEKETVKPAAAALIYKKNIGYELLIWFNDRPNKQLFKNEIDYKAGTINWFLSSASVPFKDDLASGKAWHIASYEFQKNKANGFVFERGIMHSSFYSDESISFFDCLKKGGVFISPEHLHLIQISDGKAVINPFPETNSLTAVMCSESPKMVDLRKRLMDVEREVNEIHKTNDPIIKKPVISLTEKEFKKFMSLYLTIGFFIGSVLTIIAITIFQ